MDSDRSSQKANYQEKSLYVQYGAHFCAPKEWLNFDISWTLRLQRLPVLGGILARSTPMFPDNVQYGDIVRGLPVPPNSCSGIYASHVLEHLALDEFRRALANTFKLLKPSGIFRTIVPDLEVACRRYMDSKESNSAEQFMRATGLGREVSPVGLEAHLRLILGRSQHLWMWDYKGLARELELAGFKKIRSCKFGDCSDSMFRLVEDEYRFADAVAIECVK
jgi:hypothetical protein